MLSSEKKELSGLFPDCQRWCQGAEARGANGDAARFDDPAAVAWDITGAMCRLFGGFQALELFFQLNQRVHQSKRDTLNSCHPEITSMAAVQDRNDDSATTCDAIVEWLQSMSVCSSHKLR